MYFDGWKGEEMKRESIGRSLPQGGNTRKHYNGFETKVVATELSLGKLLSRFNFRHTLKDS